jgi:hypothetical protein
MAQKDTRLVHYYIWAPVINNLLLVLQEQVRVLSERKLQLAEDEDRGKATPEEQVGLRAALG